MYISFDFLNLFFANQLFEKNEKRVFPKLRNEKFLSLQRCNSRSKLNMQEFQLNAFTTFANEKTLLMKNPFEVVRTERRRKKFRVNMLPGLYLHKFQG